MPLSKGARQSSHWVCFLQVEEALDYLRAAGITGAAKYAAGSVFCCVDEAQKIPPALEREAEVVLLKVSEAWTKLVSLPPGNPFEFLTAMRTNCAGSSCDVSGFLMSIQDAERAQVVDDQIAMRRNYFLCDSTVNKLLDTAQPSVEFTRRKYVEAHDAIVASAAYNRALEAAAQFLHKVCCPTQEMYLPIMQCIRLALLLESCT